MTWLKNNWFKLLAIAILLGSFGDHPYTYYQILRWVVCVAAGYTAYSFYESQQKIGSLVFVVITLLFNPIAPIYMNRNTWQIFDLITAFGFFASFFLFKERVHE